MLLYQVCKILLVDDTFEYQSMRKPFYQAARDIKPTSYVELHVKCPIDTAIANNKERENPMAVTEQTIRNVHSKMEVTCQYGTEYYLEVETEKLFKDKDTLNEIYVY